MCPIGGNAVDVLSCDQPNNLEDSESRAHRCYVQRHSALSWLSSRQSHPGRMNAATVAPPGNVASRWTPKSD
jgi:hypothetical protein